MQKAAAISRFAAIISMLFASLLTGCRSNPACGQVVVARSPNPASNHGNFIDLSAEIVLEDCGATVRQTMSVQLVSKDKKFFPFANGKVFSYYGGNAKVTAAWLDSNTLQIRCGDCTPDGVFWKVDKYEFVSVVYVQ